MQVRRLEHYNIRTIRFHETVEFYKSILDMEPGVPPMAPPGSRASWMYDHSGTPAIHLTAVDPRDPQGSYARTSRYRGGEADPQFHGSGAIDHIAFECEGFDEIVERLRTRDLAFAENAVPTMNMRQLFVRDPNGIMLELNFR